MKIGILILALFYSAVGQFQEQDSSEYKTYSAKLCIGDMMPVADGAIKFKKVISDSRCPKGEAITCVWAGEVKILVEFYAEGKLRGEKIITGSNILVEENYKDGELEKERITAKSNTSIAHFFNGRDLSISNIVVLPYPGTKKILPEEYSVHLIISEKIEKHFFEIFDF